MSEIVTNASGGEIPIVEMKPEPVDSLDRGELDVVAERPNVERFALDDADATAAIETTNNMPTAVAERIAMSIRRAAAINDRSWSVYRMSRGIVLSISSYTALLWRPSKQVADLLVLMPSVDERMVEKWSGNQNGGLSAHDAKWYAASHAELVELFHDLGEAHDAVIDVAASEVRTLAARADVFDNEILNAIEILSGVELPSPGYLGELDAIRQARGLRHVSGARDDEEERSMTDALALLGDRVTAQGLTYTETQLATFYAALQIKGFVILSGISGTGKSKLAQAFVECLPGYLDVAPLPDGYIERVINKTAINSGLINFPTSEILGYPIPEPNTPIPVEVDFDGYSQTCTFTVWQSKESGTVYRLYFSGEVRKQIVSLELGTPLFVRPLVNKDRTQLVGFSIKTELEHAPDPVILSAARLENHLFLSVRPDWRDSRALLGYHNPLLGAYEWTAFLRFMLRAAENFRGPEEDRIAWFVILDEMNLAHVEYYFADLLSVLESGRDAEGWTREAIRIERPEPTEEQELSEVPPAAIHLPPNLYVVGTVNMDETTHAFSPKVLDRAFTIELSEVDFANYPPTTLPEMAEMDGEAEQRAFLRAFSRDGRFVGIDKAGIADIVVTHPEVRIWMQSLNALLTRSRMQFGYRVFDEIVAFVGAYRDLLPEVSVAEAFDLAVLMKVLPKFSGSAARIERPLLDVLAWCLEPLAPPLTTIRKMADAHSDEDWVERDLGQLTFPVTALRVRRMLDTLAVEGFASFG